MEGRDVDLECLFEVIKILCNHNMKIMYMMKLTSKLVEISKNYYSSILANIKANCDNHTPILSG